MITHNTYLHACITLTSSLLGSRVAREDGTGSEGRKGRRRVGRGGVGGCSRHTQQGRRIYDSPLYEFIGGSSEEESGKTTEGRKRGAM